MSDSNSSTGKTEIDRTQAERSQNFRQRDHRYSSLPVKDILKIRMKDLGVKNVDLQKILGYPAPNVIAMIKSGAMNLPEGKVIAVADALHLDRTFLLGKIVSENNPGLWDAICTVMADHLITANELALITCVRQILDGHDVNLVESPAFMQALTPALNVIVERQKALAQAALDRRDD